MTIPTTPTTGTQPRRTQVVRIWRQNRCLRSSTIGLYLLWVRRFKAYCRAQDLEEGSQLTLVGVETFATWYARRQGIERNLAELDLADVDAFIVTCRHHYARTTVADIASSLRGFLRFLHATGRLARDLAPSVMAPIVRRGERPRGGAIMPCCSS